jgi:hypothetical protein
MADRESSIEGLDEHQREFRLDVLRKEIDAGLEQIRRGEVIELPDEASQRAFFDEIKARGQKRLNGEPSGN